MSHTLVNSNRARIENGPLRLQILYTSAAVFKVRLMSVCSVYHWPAISAEIKGKDVISGFVPSIKGRSVRALARVSNCL